MSYINNILSSPFFLLFLTAALGALLGKINIKGFTLGSTGGIFSGIFIGWLVIFICYKVGPDSVLYSTAQGYISGLRGSDGVLVPQSFMNFFLIIFICAIGLSVGKKIRSAFNANFVKLVVMGVLIPVVSMALVWGALQLAPSSTNGYQIAGLYSGAMTNSAALGTSQEVIGAMDDVNERYAELSDEEKIEFLDFIGYYSELDEGADAAYAALSDSEKQAVLDIIGYTGDDIPDSLLADSSIVSLYNALGSSDQSAVFEALGYDKTGQVVDELTDDQIAVYKSTASSQVAMGFGIAFPVGTVVIILLMTFISIMIKRNAEKTGHVIEKQSRNDVPLTPKDFVFDAAKFGTVICVGILLGAIEIPVAGATFSLGNVGGVLISALFFGNFKPFQLHFKMLSYLREFALILFMSVVGLNNGYKIISSFSGSGLYIALAALVIEIVAVAIAVGVGRLMRLDWGLLAGGISGGATSSVGLAAALNTVGGDEPTVGYGISQPFAILANVILISIFHTVFFI